MPLHDLSYQRFQGGRTQRLARSLAMARMTTLLLLKRRSFLLLLCACWIPVIVRAAQIYIARHVPQASQFVTVDALLWQNFLTQQVEYLPVLLVALYAGAGAISTDLSSGAFVAYLSKPISRVDYFLGKAIPVLGAILAVTLVPALALFAVQLSVANDFGVLETAPLLPLSVIAYSLWMGFYFTVFVLAISCLSRSGRVAGAGFVALVLGSRIVLSGAISRLRLPSPPKFFSMIDATVDSAHVFFGNVSSGDAPYLSIVAMTSLMLLSAIVLQRRLGSAEVAS